MPDVKQLVGFMLAIMATGALLNAAAQFQPTRTIARFISGGYE